MHIYIYIMFIYIYIHMHSKYHKHGTSATQPDQGYFGNPAMKFRRLSNQAAGAFGEMGMRIRLKNVWTTEVL